MVASGELPLPKLRIQTTFSPAEEPVRPGSQRDPLARCEDSVLTRGSPLLTSTNLPELVRSVRADFFSQERGRFVPSSYRFTGPKPEYGRKLLAVTIRLPLGQLGENLLL